MRPVCDRVALSAPLVRLGRQANEPDPGVHDRQAVGLAVERRMIRSWKINNLPTCHHQPAPLDPSRHTLGPRVGCHCASTALLASTAVSSLTRHHRSELGTSDGSSPFVDRTGTAPAGILADRRLAWRPARQAMAPAVRFISRGAPVCPCRTEEILSGSTPTYAQSNGANLMAP